MAEKINDKVVKETYGLMAGGNPRDTQIIATGTKAEMLKLKKDRLKAYKDGRAGQYAEIVKL